MEQGDSKVLMVRQPIFNDKLKIVAYQLRYKHSEQAEHALFDSDAEGSNLLINTFTSLCQDGKLGRVPLLLPFPNHMLSDDEPLMLPQTGLVIEISPDIKVTDVVLSHIKALRKNKFRVALDGFALQPNLLPLVKLVNIVKVDFSHVSKQKIQLLVKMLLKAGITPLAENVDDFETLKFCKAAGFKLYQGKFISRPTKVLGKEVPGNSAALLRLLAQLQKSDITPAEIEELIIMDAKLSFKILRVVNSAAYQLTSPITSMHQAIVLLGHNQLRKWATLITLASSEDKPEELSRNFLARGRMCELVAQSAGIGQEESAFMVGMISQLDVLLDVEMDTLLEQIPLEDEIKSAISHHRGSLGDLLKAVVAFEESDWLEVEKFKLGKEFFDVAYRHSLQWADQALEALGSDEVESGES
ncbi:MAG: HDOD domain-containing protein [Neptuniibacter sp.]